jgi:multiple sugar transport system ATP-binding protein
VKVLEKFDLEVAQSEFIVLLGPSGCGKSTLLNAIAGLVDLHDGQIWIGGNNVTWEEPKDRGIAMVFQSYALYPRMTVRGNLSFGLKVAGMPPAEIARRVDTAATMLKITELLDRRPSELSGGQRQRVAIGRAIVRQPKLFLFDEPLSNLDAALRSRTRHEIMNLHRRIEAAMIFVTHDQTEAMTLADRIVVMNDRRIEQVGAPLDIYRRPATAFVAGFVGSPAMNFLSVERAADGALQRVRLGDGVVVGTGVSAAALPAAGELRLGLRAEAIRLCAPEAGDTRAVVEFVEYLGDRTQVYVCLASGEKLVAAIDAASPVRVGETVGVGFDGGAAHLFDAAGLAHHAA